MQKFALLVAVVALLAAAGCGNDATGQALSKDEEARFRAAPGQPMPAEAREFMEKANRDAQEKMKQGGAPAGAAPVPPPPSVTAPR